MSRCMSFSVASRASTPSSFFFNDTATTEIYTLSLHDALPICIASRRLSPTPIARSTANGPRACPLSTTACARHGSSRSEEHTSELQSQSNLVCRLLLEKKKRDVERGDDADHRGEPVRTLEILDHRAY